MQIENHNQRLGRLGEQKAQSFLLKKGYKIICSNYRTKRGEIDIIAEENNTLVIIEVKTRIKDDFVAIEAITRKKQKNMARAAEIFLAKNLKKYQDWPIRFDVVAIDLEKINLVQDAFILT